MRDLLPLCWVEPQFLDDWVINMHVRRYRFILQSMWICLRDSGYKSLLLFLKHDPVR